MAKDIIEQDALPFDAYKCVSCGEEIMTMEQLASLAYKYRQLRKASEVRFAKWGNSIAIRIPSEFVRDFNIREGKQGVMTKDKKGIRILPE